MTSAENSPSPVVSVDEIQKGWTDLTLRVSQLEAEKATLEHENKTLRFLVERVVEHRQKSHSELVLLLTGLVSKLPLNDVGLIVSKLVEHNANVSEICAGLVKGRAETALPQPVVLKALEQMKRELSAVLKSAIDELVQLDPPFEVDLLQSFVSHPDTFLSPRAVRATRCFIKGQVPRERVVREFGEAALVFFQDMTTDPKANPHPKAEEIVLAFKGDFETVFQQNPGVIPEKREQLMALYQKVQRSKAQTEKARAQRNAFQRASFVLELLHYYENQSTEAPDVVFAQRLPALVEQLVISGPQDGLDEKLIKQAETLLAFIANPDHRMMVINNMGKAGGSARALRFVLALRSEKVPDQNHVIQELMRHLISGPKPPPVASLTPVLRLIKPEMQKAFARAIFDYERLRKDEAVALAREVGKELGLTAIESEIKASETVSPEVERQLAWEKIKEMILSRADPGMIASTIRDRLHARYDADEMKQSWVTLTEADPISLIRVFCHLPYLSDGRTDPVARAVMETYVTRLTHEKYASTYAKVLSSLRNMHKANPNSPTLVNFMALVKWVDSEAATKLGADVGVAVAAH